MARRRGLIAAGLWGLLGCGVDAPMPGLAAMCFNEANGCDCSGFLIDPTTVVSAGHCSDTEMGATPPRFAVFGRTDPNDASTGVAIRVERRCTNSFTTSETCLEMATETDLDLYFLEEPVPASAAVPLRVGTTEDLNNPTAEFSAAGYGLGDARTVTFPAPPVTCPVMVQDNFPGRSTCFGVLGGTSLTTNGDSGGPLYVDTGDGELAVVGALNGGQAGFDVFTDLNAHIHLLPGVRRPPLFEFDITDLWPWRRQCVWDIGPLEVAMIVPTSMQVDDFDGDGNDDAFFAVDDGFPRVLLGPQFDELETSALADASVYPFTIVAGDWTGDHAGLAVVDVELAVHTIALDGAAWVASELPELALEAYDPMWGGAGLHSIGEDGPNFVTDPLLRPGDLDGDGRTDLLAVLSENLLFAVNAGDSWETQTVPLSDLELPNSPAYRESLSLADVAPGVEGDELLVRDGCGLVVYGHSANGLFELFRQDCGDDPWVLSDDNGYDTFNRWDFETGLLNDDACADIMLRDRSRLHVLLSNCDAAADLEFVPSGDPGASWHAPFAGHPGWGAGDLGGRFMLADLDGDGRDDVIGNGPHGVLARVNRDDGQTEPTFASVGGAHPDFSGAAAPWLDVDDWVTLQGGDFTPQGRQLISLNASLACLELVGLW